MNHLVDLINFIIDHTFSLTIPINLIFFCVIFSLFSFTLIRVFIKYWITNRSVKKGRSYLFDITLNNIDLKYFDLKEKFLQDKYFHEHWREFDETLRKIKEGNQTSYYNTAEASYFLNIDTLFYNRFSSGFYFIIPTILTGLGILGTFVGLVFGLQFFESVNFADTESVATASEGLLSGIGASFITSVWGLFFSIFLNLILSRIKSDAELEIKIFTDKLEALFPRHISAEGEGLFEIKKELEKHTTALESFSTKLAHTVSAALEDGINKSLAPTVEKMAGVMERFSMEKSENVAHTLSSLVTDFKESLTGAAQTEIENLNKTLDSITSSLNQSNNTFSLMLKQWEENIQDQSDLSKNQKMYIDMIGTNLEKIDHSSSKINEITDVQKAVLLNFNNVIDQIDKIRIILFPLESCLDKANEASEKYLETAQLFNNSSEQFNSAIKLNNILIQNQRDTINEMAPLADNLKNTIYEIKTPLSEISNTISDLKNIEGIKLETYDKVNNMTDNLNLLFNTINDYESKMKNLVNEFSSTTNSARELWEGYRNTFETIQKEINEGIIQYTDTMREKSKEIFVQYDESLSSGLKHISQSIMDLVESFESLEDKLEELTEGKKENV
ncbi:anti-phage ZorAB system protein ZorA [Bacteroidota bacterium]